MKLLVLLLSLSLPMATYGADVKKLNPEIMKARQLFCKGDFKAFKKVVNGAKSGSDSYLRLHLMLLDTKEGQVEAAKKIKDIPSDVKLIGEAERIELAAALVASNSKDIKKLKDLISFSSKNTIIEAYREEYASYVDASAGSTNLVANQLNSAEGLLPFTDPWFLMTSLLVNISNKEATSFRNSVDQRVQLFSNDDGFHYELLAYEGYAMIKVQNMDQLKADFEKAYKLCPYDQMFEISYSALLLRDHELVKSEKTLDEVKKNHLFLVPEFYYYSGDLHLAQQKLDLAEQDMYNAIDNLSFEPLKLAEYTKIQSYIFKVAAHKKKTSE